MGEGRSSAFGGVGLFLGRKGEGGELLRGVGGGCFFLYDPAVFFKNRDKKFYRYDVTLRSDGRGVLTSIKILVSCSAI